VCRFIDFYAPNSLSQDCPYYEVILPSTPSEPWQFGMTCRTPAPQVTLKRAAQKLSAPVSPSREMG